MSLIVNNNQSSLNAQRHLSGTQSKQNQAMERIATGKKINSGKDDAAALAISAVLGADVRALNQSVVNTNDGISMAKVGDAALSEVSDMLERMQGLETQKGNGALSADDIASIDGEMASLQEEINKIQSGTKFNDQSLLDGFSADFTVGESETYTMSVDAVNVDVGGTVPDIATAIDNVSRARGQFGSSVSDLGSRAANSATRAENLTAARSQILDADLAAELAELTKANIQQKAGISVQAQGRMNANMVSSLLQG